MCSGICAANLNALVHISTLAIALVGILFGSHFYRSVNCLTDLVHTLFSARVPAAPEYYALSPSCSAIPP